MEMPEVSSNDLPSSSSSLTDPEATRLEENHRQFADLLDRLESSTEELRVLRRLVELRIRTIELLQEAEDQSAATDDPAGGVPLSPKRVVHYESMIRSDAFGKCNICFEDEPFDPVGCIYCLQLVGCRKCVNRWYEAACRLSRKQCPLCRHEWEDQPEVLDIFELKLS